jgi:ADP-ribose pyrophosphatase
MSGEQLQPWQVVARRELLDGSPWLRVWAEDVRLPQGGMVEGFYTLEMPDYVMMVALTLDERVIVEHSYKHGPRRVSLSLPAGYLAAGEDPLVAARRELLEETGYRAAAWYPLGSFVSDGNRGASLGHFFLARDAQQVAEPQSGDHEEMVIELLPLPDVTRALLAGDVAIVSSAAIIGLALAHLGTNQEAN